MRDLSWMEKYMLEHKELCDDSNDDEQKGENTPTDAEESEIVFPIIRIVQITDIGKKYSDNI